MERNTIKGILRIYECSHGPVNGLPFNPMDLQRALRDGDAKLSVETSNMVVDTGLDCFPAFIANNVSAPLVGGNGFEALTDITVQKMEVGNAENPPTPATSDTMGVGQLKYLPNLLVTYPVRFQVLFSGIIPPSECNGLLLTEEALKLGNGKLFARTTFLIAKDSTKSLQFDHLIIFGRG